MNSCKDTFKLKKSVCFYKVTHISLKIHVNKYLIFILLFLSFRIYLWIILELFFETTIAFNSIFFNSRTISKTSDCFTVSKICFCYYLTPTGINTKLGISNLVHPSSVCVLFRSRTCAFMDFFVFVFFYIIDK